MTLDSMLEECTLISIIATIVFTLALLRGIHNYDAYSVHDMAATTALQTLREWTEWPVLA